jgi:hypothetical protein
MYEFMGVRMYYYIFHPPPSKIPKYATGLDAALMNCIPNDNIVFFECRNYGV